MRGLRPAPWTLWLAWLLFPLMAWPTPANEGHHSKSKKRYQFLLARAPGPKPGPRPGGRQSRLGKAGYGRQRCDVGRGGGGSETKTSPSLGWAGGRAGREDRRMELEYAVGASRETKGGGAGGRRWAGEAGHALGSRDEVGSGRLSYLSPTLSRARGGWASARRGCPGWPDLQTQGRTRVGGGRTTVASWRHGGED